MQPKRQVGLAVLRAWWALQLQKRRRARAEQPELPLPQLAHHPYGGVPGAPLCDDIYLGENPGAVVTDTVEIWVLDPAIHVIEGYPNPTEADWQEAIKDSIPYFEPMGRWYYENPGVGEGKSDGDYAWIRGRFCRGQEAGPWSLVDYGSGAGQVVWSY